MNTAFVVFSRDGSPYMVVETSKAGTTFKPVNDAAKNLARAFADEYRQSEITKAELSAALDVGMEVEGPMPPNTVAGKLKTTRKNNEKYLPVTSVSDTPIGHFSQTEFKNIVSYKASAFAVERYKTTFNYEVKRVRAVWDPGLSVPGTNRRGGWRCPTGTRYGGQITDRFGRNCGWGIARRIANAISDVGEQLGDIGEQRDGRRRQRRERQIAERAQRAGQTGRVERGLRGVAERLEGGEARPARERGEGRIERGLRRVAGRLEGTDGETRVPSTPERVTPEAPQPRRPQGQRPRAPRAPRDEQQRQPTQPVVPARPRRPRAPIQRPEERRTPEAVAPAAPKTPRTRLGDTDRDRLVDKFIEDLDIGPKTLDTLARQRNGTPAEREKQFRDRHANEDVGQLGFHARALPSLKEAAQNRESKYLDEITALLERNNIRSERDLARLSDRERNNLDQLIDEVANARAQSLLSDDEQKYV